QGERDPMTTSFQCPTCQKKLHAAVDGAGKKVKCPGCGTVFVLPVAGAANPPPPQPVRTAKAAVPEPPQGSAGVSSPEVAAQNCPSCHAPLNAGAALCVNCGLDLRTGKKLH